MKEISINAMALLTEHMKTGDAWSVLRWFRRNKNDFEKEELINIVGELLHGVAQYRVSRLIEDVGCELDEKYDEIYQKGDN